MSEWQSIDRSGKYKQESGRSVPRQIAAADEGGSKKRKSKIRKRGGSKKKKRAGVDDDESPRGSKRKGRSRSKLKSLSPPPSLSRASVSSLASFLSTAPRLTPPILNCALTTESAAFLSTEETSLALLAWEAPTSVRSDADTAEAKEVGAISSIVFLVCCCCCC